MHLTSGANPIAATTPARWSDAVVYQVYLRSFRDSNGDGIGDLPGLRDGLPYIASLGCDAIWINPCYASPQRDHGYDISDYMSIDPAYGDLGDFDDMLTEAHRLGIRVLMDMVANHCSVEHAWFREAVAAPKGSPQRDRFIFRDGRGTDASQPPNNWESVFGGSAWTPVDGPAGHDGQWYLHSFDPGQPDFNWRNTEVPRYFDDVLRFWFDRGVDGFRVDVAHGLFKDRDLPDHTGTAADHNFAMWDLPEVHDVYRSWRRIGDSYPDKKYFVGEVWVPSAERLADYLRPDELHQAFTFDLLVQPWQRDRIRNAIDSGLRIGGGRPAWTLANHDVHRTATRYGQEQAQSAPPPTDMIAAARRTGPADIALGQRRSRAAVALLLALPGSAYLFQGEELGLPEVFDLPDDARQDPIWHRSDGRQLGRDGCRVPLPWSVNGTNFGFSPAGAQPAWLPQPYWFADLAVAEQDGCTDTMLTLHRRLVAERRRLFDGGSDLSWLSSPDEVLAFRRGEGVCVVNFGPQEFEPPREWGVLTPVIWTGGSPDGHPTGDSTTWYRTT